MLGALLFGSLQTAYAKKASNKDVQNNNQQIRLVWQHHQAPAYDLTLKKNLPGINVIAPVWYEMTNDYGKIVHKSTDTYDGYVERAHDKGYHVWPLVTNGFNPDRTKKFLQDKNAKAYFVDQLLEEAKLYHFDGINIDFENIYDDDRDALTDFIAYFYRRAQHEKLTLSIDVTIPSNTSFWSLCFDRKALAQNVDYVMVMTYDEYYGGSPIPGPTASYNWDEKSVQAVLEEGVPTDKFVFGIPLYMRLWKKGAEDNRYYGKTLDMSGAEKIIQEKSTLPSWKEEWLPDERMTRYSYEEDDTQYIFWKEDAQSLVEKTKLIGQYNLAGFAAWRAGFETLDVWKKLEHNK